MEPHMLQPHSFPRSLSEEAQLARMNTGYNHMLDGQQSSQDFPGKSQSILVQFKGTKLCLRMLGLIWNPFCSL